MSFWLADDIMEMGPTFQEILRGKTQFFEKYRSYLKGPLEILSYRIIRPEVVSLSARLALVYFSYKMKVKRKSKVVSSQGKESMLLEKIGSRWRVKFIHWHQDFAEQP